MKKFFIFLLGLFLLVSISCSNNFNRLFKDTSISITLPFQGREAWSKSDITSYKITLTSDADENITQTQTATPEKPTVTFQELEPGTYSIQALAYSEETEVAGGQTKVTVEEGQNATATIKMTLYQTKSNDKTSDTVTITFNCNYKGGPAEVQWKDVKTEKEQLTPGYNSFFKDANFTYGDNQRYDSVNSTYYNFCGWSIGKPAEYPFTDCTIIQLADKYKFTEDVTLYAVWCNQDVFSKDEGNFQVNYSISSSYNSYIYYLKSHRDSITMPTVTLLYPELSTISFATGLVWSTDNENFKEAYQAKTFNDITIPVSIKFTFTFNCLAAILYNNGSSVGDSFYNSPRLIELETLDDVDIIDGKYYHYLPTSFETAKEWGMGIPDGYEFDYWSLSPDGGTKIERINLNENKCPDIYAIWKTPDPEPEPGTEVIHIATAEDLLNYTAQKYDTSKEYSVYLDSDITLDSWKTTLLSKSNQEFKGVFYGKNHTITIKNAEYPLFWDTNQFSHIRDLNLNVNYSSYSNTTGVRSIFCLTNYGTITNCKITGTVSSSVSLTSIFGDGNIDKFNDCSSTVTDSENMPLDVRIYEKGVSKSEFLNYQYKQLYQIINIPTDYTTLNYFSNFDTNAIKNYSSSDDYLYLEEDSTNGKIILKSSEGRNPFGGDSDAIITLKYILNIGIICEYNGNTYYFGRQYGYERFLGEPEPTYISIIIESPDNVYSIVTALNSIPML